MTLDEVVTVLEIPKDYISKGWAVCPDGLISVNEDGDIEVDFKSVHNKMWPWIPKNLSFMELVYTNTKKDYLAHTTTISGTFLLDRLPTKEEVDSIRKELGLRKIHSNKIKS